MVSPDRSPVQPALKTVATVCRFPVLKVAMIRGLPHPVLHRLLLGQHRNATMKPTGW